MNMDKKTIILIFVMVLVLVAIIFGVMYYMNKIAEQNNKLTWTPIQYQSPMASFTDALMPDSFQLF